MKNILIFFLLLLSGFLNAQNIYGYWAMGTIWSFTIKDDNITSQIADQVFQEVKRIEKIFSNYDEYSELAELNQTENWMPVSPEMLEVIKFAEELRERSNGAFDIRIGQSIDLWKKGIKEGDAPKSSALNSKLTEDLELQVDYNLVKTNAHTKLDFGGIAKGYAIDKVFEMFINMGYDTILIDGGGDMRMGSSPTGKGWKIAQFYEKGKILWLENTAIATSGSYYQYLEQDSLRYSHIIDPADQQAVSIDRGITVKAPTCMEADALATAISVSGHYETLQNFYEFQVNILENGEWTTKQF
ncbi:FAD:protein FMN transferase [Portibacter marinus]|uniref:FAD:protein FMN transferase n=1 Tax=Portibacter marinus TaxID=2898660 RepID=UPI001F42643A|nr:FAD:protein FMN transferase [Portibacter marinus]